MDGTEFRAIRKLQKEREDTDSQVEQYLDLVEAGSSLAPPAWLQLDNIMDGLKHLEWEDAEIQRHKRKAERRHDHAFELPF